MSYRNEKNLAIFGGTQQGKSVLANEIYAKDRRIGIFFAPDPEPWFVGVKVRSFEDLATGLKHGKTKFVVPTPLWGDISSTHEKWCRHVLSLCEGIHNLQVVMVHDESQDLHGGMLKKVLKRGLKRGMRNVLVTQSPASRKVSLEPLRQCEYYGWVGPIGKMDVEYLENKALFDPKGMLNNKDHQYVIVNRQGSTIDTGITNNSQFGDG